MLDDISPLDGCDPQQMPSAMTVVVVASSADNGTQALCQLQSQGYRILEAETAADGLLLWQTEHPEVALVDAGLPDGEVSDFLTEIATDTTDERLPAIVLMGSGQEQIALQAMKLGAADFLAKETLTVDTLDHSLLELRRRQAQKRKLHRVQQREALMADIAVNIQQQTRFEALSSTIVQEIQRFLAADRVVIYKFGANMDGIIVAEAVVPPWRACLESQVIDTCFRENMGGAYRQGRVCAVSDVRTAGLSDCYRQLLEAFQVRANLVVPILLPTPSGNTLWGLLIAHQCSGARQWENSDVQLLQRLSVQLAIALQKSELYGSLEDLNASLEAKVHRRTEEIRNRAQREQLVMGIAAKIRASLDAQKILDYAVLETRLLLGCDRVIVYQLRPDLSGMVVAESILDQDRSVLHSEVHDPCISAEWLAPYRQGKLRVVNDVYDESFSQCHQEMLAGFDIRAKLMVPIVNNGDLWGLMIASHRDRPYAWPPHDITLVQQLSVQIAIALQQGLTHQRLQQELQERQQVELQLRESERRYASLAATVPVGIYRANIADNHCAYVNQRYCEILGLSPDVRAYKTWEERLHPEDAARVTAAWEAAICEHRPIQMEYRLQNPNGTVTWVYEQASVERDIHGQAIGYVGTLSDITERKQAEAALRRSETRFRKLFESTAKIAVQGYDRHGRVIYWNQASEELYGYGQQEALGQRLEDLFVPTEVWGQVASDFPAPGPGEHSTLARELELTRKDGSTVTVFSSHIVLTNLDGQLEMYCVDIDLSDRKRIEEQLHRLNQELEVKVQARTAELQEREARYRALVDVIPDLLIRLQADGTYLDIVVGEDFQLFNPGRALTGCNIYDVTPPDHARQRMQYVQRALQTQTVQTYEYELSFEGKRYSEETRIVAINEQEVLVIVQNIHARKRAEMALRESEARWQFALEGQGDGVWDWHLETNKVFYSQQWKALLGYDDDEIGDSLGECVSRIHPEDIDRVNADLSRHFQGETPVYQNEHRVCCKDGLYKWTLNRGKVIAWSADGKPLRVIGTLSDITERKEAEVRLKESEERYRSVYEQAVAGFANADAQGRFLSVNPHFCELLGYSAEELLRKTVAEITHPEDRDRIRPAITALFADKLPNFLQEKRYLRKDGSYFWSSTGVSLVRDGDGKPKHTLAVIRDISDRKRAEAALQNLVTGTAATTGQDFFAALVKHIAIALAVPYAIVTQRVGDRLQALAFWSKGSLQPTFAFHPAKTPCERTLAEGYFYCVDSLQQWFPGDIDLAQMQAESYLGVALNSQGGDAIGDLCILDQKPIQDSQRAGQILTVFAARASAELERQRASIALETLNQELEAKVEARTAALKTREIQLQASNQELEAFAYSVSHDLRAPLRAINGFSKIILEDYGQRFDGEAADYFDRICYNVTRMEQLINDLLSLSRVARAEICRNPVNLTTLAQEIIGELSAAEPARNVEIIIAPNLIVSADRALMRVVLNNLLQNAWKFTSHHSEARIEFGAKVIEGTPAYFVSDDGAGFNMAYVEKLFGAFQRLHGNHEFAGTGIGLATVQRIIHRHGGSIWAEGALEKGATFYFTLPDT